MKKTTYFDEGFLEFFHSLAGNNNTTWFHNHKQHYAKQVKKPFEAFIDDLIVEIQGIDPTLQVTAKDCILRINRDIRFSKDKTPYNLHYTAFVSNGGRRDKSIPGLFLRFSPESVGIMGGCYYASTEQRQKIRNHIGADISGFRKLVDEQPLVEKFGTIQGESAKRIPAELKDVADKEPLILNKQWYFVAEREPDIIVSPNLMQEIMSYYQAAKPVNDFLLRAIGS